MLAAASVVSAAHRVIVQLSNADSSSEALNLKPEMMCCFFMNDQVLCLIKAVTIDD